MKRVRRWCCLVGLGVLGCQSSSDSSGPETSSEAPPPVEGGQIGGIGASSTEEDCKNIAQTWVDDVTAPLASSSVTASARCGQVSFLQPGPAVSGPACQCDPSGLVGPHGDFCSVLDRANGCLYSALDFPGCDPNDPSSCDATCRELDRRLAEDAAKTYAAEVKLARVSGGSCEIIVQIAGHCFVYGSMVAYDCALGNEEILRLEAERYAAELAADMAAVSTLPASNYFPRDPNEWQGMLVDLSLSSPCDSSAHCGMARACVDAVCWACTLDSQCAPGEGCVLDHCVLLTNIGCRSYRDCPAGSLCLLSGYTGGTPRGNEDMRAYCL